MCLIPCPQVSFSPYLGLFLVCCQGVTHPTEKSELRCTHGQSVLYFRTYFSESGSPPLLSGPGARPADPLPILVEASGGTSTATSEGTQRTLLERTGPQEVALHADRFGKAHEMARIPWGARDGPLPSHGAQALDRTGVRQQATPSLSQLWSETLLGRICAKQSCFHFSSLIQNTNSISDTVLNLKVILIKIAF